jgi:hypothetical protein
MIEGNVVMTWIAAVAAKAIRAWRWHSSPAAPNRMSRLIKRTFPHFAVDRRGLRAFRWRSTIPEAFTGAGLAKRVPRCGMIRNMLGRVSQRGIGAGREGGVR